MQVQHGRLAIETGVAAENVFIIENGTPIEIYADGTARRGASGTAGYVFVDGLSVGEVGEVVLRDRRARQRRHLHDRRHGRQADRLGRRPARDHHPRVRATSTSVTPSWRGHRPGHRRRRHAGRPHQRDRPAQDPDQGRRVELPVRADEAPPDGVSGRGRGLTVATRRRTSTSRQASPRRRRRSGLGVKLPGSARRSPVDRRHHVPAARRRHPHRPRCCRVKASSPTGGAVIAPWFESRALAAAVPAAGAGWYLEWVPASKPNSGWGATVIGIAIAFVGLLGCIEILSIELFNVERGGGGSGASSRSCWSRC